MVTICVWVCVFAGAMVLIAFSAFVLWHVPGLLCLVRGNFEAYQRVRMFDGSVDLSRAYRHIKRHRARYDAADQMRDALGRLCDHLEPSNPETSSDVDYNMALARAQAVLKSVADEEPDAMSDRENPLVTEIIY